MKTKISGLWQQIKESNRIEYKSNITTEDYIDTLSEIGKFCNRERIFNLVGGELTMCSFELLNCKDPERKKYLEDKIEKETIRLNKQRLEKVMRITGFTEDEAKLIDRRYADRDRYDELVWEINSINLGDNEYDDSYESEIIICKNGDWEYQKYWSDGHYGHKVLKKEQLNGNQIKERYLDD